MKRRRLPILVVVLLLVSALGVGCSKDSKHITNASGTVAEANQMLEDILYAQVTSTTNPQRPADVDFMPAYNKYQEALRIDPNNSTAHLGVAVLGMMSVTQDAEINSAFDEWKDYLKNHVPFVVTSSASRPLGVPLGLTGSHAALALPFQLGLGSALAMARPDLVTADPQLGRVQNIIRQRVLPKLREAIQHLDRVVANPAYVFVVTPRMQGDRRETAVEIDHTDILALRASCQLLAALCEMAVAYDMNFAAYDSASLVTNFTKGSHWLALGPDGAAGPQRARELMLEASDGVDSTIVSLLAETDNQADDVIKMGSDPRSMADVDSIRSALPRVRQALTGRYTITDNWDSDPYTPPVPLTFDLGHFFTAPVPDWKALLPNYTVSTERHPYRRAYYYDNGADSVSVDIRTSGYTYANYFINVLQHDATLDTTEYFYGDSTFLVPMRQLALARMHDLDGIPGWTGESAVSEYASGTYDPGVQRAGVNWQRSWWTSNGSVVIPVVTWEAETFETWTWPDPTLGGLLPDVHTTASLLGIFGIAPSQWQRRNVLDWPQPRGFNSTRAVAWSRF